MHLLLRVCNEAFTDMGSKLAWYGRRTNGDSAAGNLKTQACDAL